MAPNVQPYISPKQRAETRARHLSWLYWTAVAIPVAGMLVMFGYSSQAPLWLSSFTIKLDAAFGFPVLWLIKMIAA
ncbi:MAG: hypothetical protein ABI830_04150 [Pseudolabrys sp.]